MSTDDRAPPTPQVPILYDPQDVEPTPISESLLSLIQPGSGSQPQRAELTVISGRNAGAVYPVGSSAIVIGRSSAADIRLLDEGISRRHVRIYWIGETVRIEDLGSANGVALNGTVVRASTLRDGDHFRLGSTTTINFNIVDDFQRRLLRADRLVAIGRLAAGVAHEMNNPTAFITANLKVSEERLEELSELLEAPHVLDDATREAAREILGDLREILQDNLVGVGRIRSVAEELRWFSRSERDHIEIVKVEELIQAACKMVRSQVKHGMRLVEDVGSPAAVKADRGKLTQVIVNLLLNAAQAAEQADGPGTVVVSCQVHESQVKISVDDDGPGVPESIRDKIFEPFFSTKSRYVGTGLGLSLCLDMVRKHGGQLEVGTSTLGGARFDVTLPLLVAGGQESSPMETFKARILVIDDDPLLLKAMSRSLTHHEVTTVQGGDEAMSLLGRDQKFDVIFCDIVMPDTDGVEVHRLLRERAPALLERVVFWTGGTFTDRTKNFVQSVPNICLGKPVEHTDLQSVIQQVYRSTHRSPDSSFHDGAGRDQ